jgi:hypothetical protein
LWQGERHGTQTHPPKPPKYKCWYIRGTIQKGRRIFESTGTTRRREAQLVLDKFENDRLNGKLGRKVQSFAKAAEAYIESVKPSTRQCQVARCF